MTSFAVRTTLRDFIPRIVDELGDLWAIAVAEIAAGAAFVLGRSELEAVAVGAAVLVVRVAAGLLLPTGARPALRERPMRERQIRSHLEKGSSIKAIAVRMKVSERYVARVQREFEREKHREARSKAADGPEKPKRPWYDDPRIRGTLTVAGFISFAYTMFRILDELLGSR